MALSLGLEGGVALEWSDDHIDGVKLAVKLERRSVVVSGASSPSPSFRRAPEGGFALHLQQLLAEDFDRGSVVEALARGVVGQLEQLDQPFEAELAEVQTPRQQREGTDALPLFAA